MGNSSNHTSNKGIVVQIYKDYSSLLQVNNRKIQLKIKQII